MAEIIRVKIDWTGFIGAPGYTNLYFRDFTEGAVDQSMADGAVVKTDIWLDAYASSINNTVSYVINPTVDILEETTGELQGFMTVAPDTARVGSQTAAYSAVSGGCINWYTNGVRNGRRVRGRTFMVPLAANAYATDGTLDATKLTTFRAANLALISPTGSGDLGVWSRPSGPEATDGAWYFATATTMADKAAVLRSRRD